MNLLEKVKRAGVIGAGGAGFPTHVKLQSKAEYVLLNGAECEPLLRVDQQLMEFYGEEIISGLNMAADFTGARKAIIGIKVKHKKVIKILKDTIEELGLNDRIEIKTLPDIYPAGDEQVLVYELTSRVVPETGIPIAVGCIVMNTETALNVYNAAEDQAVIMKYVTVAGDVPNPVTVKVPVGTPIKSVLEQCGISDFTDYSVIDGGPMMGPLLKDMNSFVTKKTKGLVVLKSTHSLIARKKKTMKSAVMLNKTACEQCRMCTDLCPRYLLGHSTSPHKMVRAAGYGLGTHEDKTVAFTCCQCNLCEYFSCPAGINPKMANVYYMNLLREAGIKHKPVKEDFSPRHVREYRLIPSKRLVARLNLQYFDKPAPLKDGISIEPSIVGMSLRDHVGAPAVSVVNVGDRVNAGDKIAEIPEGALGAAVHASISGIVEAVEPDLITVRRG